MSPPSALVAPLRSQLFSATLNFRVNSAFEDISINLTQQPYWYPTGDGLEDDLLLGFRDGLTNHSLLNPSNIFVELRPDGRIEIRASPASRVIGINDWGTFPRELFGWRSIAASGNPLVSPFPSPLVFLPGSAVAGDTLERDVIGQGRSVSWTGAVSTVRYQRASKRREFRYDLLERTRALDQYADPDFTSFESFDREALSFGYPFRYYEDASRISDSTIFEQFFRTYFLERRAELRQNRAYSFRWDVDLVMRSAEVP